MGVVRPGVERASAADARGEKGRSSSGTARLRLQSVKNSIKLAPDRMHTARQAVSVFEKIAKRDNYLLDRLERGVSVILVASVTSVLAVRDAISVGLVCLFALSVVYFLARGAKPLSWGGEDLWYGCAMVGLLLATFLGEMGGPGFDIASLDGPSRFLLVIPIYLMMKGFRPTALLGLQYAFPAGVWAGLCVSMIFPWKHLPLPGTYFVDPTNYSAAMMILGFLSLTAVNWGGADSKAVITFKVSAFVVGLSTAVQTGERGVWLGIPVLLAVWAGYLMPRTWLRRAAVVVVFGLLGVYLFLPKVEMRILATGHEIQQIIKGNFETSVGQRLQIWTAALSVIKEHPILGVGPSGTAGALKEMSHRGLLSPSALEYGLAQVHNEVLAHTLKSGVVGLFAILAVYLVPMNLFWRGLACPQAVARISSLMGLQIVLGYLVVGLTIEVFNLKTVATFYALLVAALLAISYNYSFRSTILDVDSGHDPGLRDKLG